MSQVTLAGNVSGTGIFTVAAPNSNTNRTLTLPNNSGTVITTASTGAVTDTMLATLVVPIGVGQTWQNVTASRAAGTTFTNTTGRPIQVNISGRTFSLTSTLTLIVSGVSVHQSFFTFNVGTIIAPGTLTAVVPAGATYLVTSSNYTIQIWAELR